MEDLEEYVDDLEEITDEKPNVVKTSEMIGVCKKCGCVITQDNFYKNTKPLVCKDCAIKIISAKKKKKEAKVEDIKKDIKKPLIIGFVVGGLILAFFLVATLVSIFSTKDPSDLILLIAGIILAYSGFSIAFELAYGDSWVADMFLWFLDKPFGLPGVIIDISIDGIIFFILFKLGMAILSFILGVLLLLLGLALAIVFAPFTFPFTYSRAKSELKEAEQS